MRTSNELSTLYKSIDQTKISDSAKETLKKIRLANKNWKGKDEDAQELFIEFFNKLKSSKPVAVKTTQEYKDALKKAQIERGKKMREGKAKTKAPQGAGTEEDANRPAKPFGWRMRGKHNYRKPTRDDISKGKAYYEGRVNRADVKRKKYPMLERGGELGEKLFSIYPHSVGKAKYVIDVYDGNSTNKDGSPFIGIRTAQNKVKLNSTINSLKEDGFKEVDNVFNYLKNYEDGGYMAKGGEIGNYRIIPYKRVSIEGSPDLVEPYYSLAFTVVGSLSEANERAQKYVIENEMVSATITKIHPSGQALKNKKVSYVTKDEILKYEDGGMAEGREIEVGDLVKHKKYGWIMRVDKIDDGKFYLENDKEGMAISGKAGNNGSYGKSDIKKYAKGGYMAKGGAIDEMAVYVSARDIEEIKLTINGDKKTLKGSDLMDGVYVKKSSLKAKFDAYEVEGELANIAYDVWDKLKIESGSQIYNSNSIQKKLEVEYEKAGIDSLFKKLTKMQKKKVAEALTDENQHSLRNYLALRGYLGDEEYNDYKRLHNEYGKTFLNPSIITKAVTMAEGGEVFYTEKHKND